MAAFQSTTYVPEEGVMAFYHRMIQYAAQMVRPPDRYMFKRQLIMRLPKDVFDYLLIKEVSEQSIPLWNQSSPCKKGRGECTPDGVMA